MRQRVGFVEKSENEGLGLGKWEIYRGEWGKQEIHVPVNQRSRFNFDGACVLYFDNEKSK